MNLEVNDKVFGNMIYKHSWIKQEIINWWGGKEFKIKIKAHAYKGQDILECQRNAYKKYLNETNKVISKAIPLLIQYLQSIKENSITEVELYQHLIPTEVIFMRDSEWGILFDTDWDEENGIAIYTENHEVKVGPEDSFL